MEVHVRLLDRIDRDIDKAILFRTEHIRADGEMCSMRKDAREGRQLKSQRIHLIV